jgi:7-cyano-7-deazaguanine reductase
MGATIEEAILNYEEQVKEDIGNCIGANVDVKFFQSGDDELFFEDPAQGYTDLYKTIPAKQLANMTIDDYSAKNYYSVVDSTGQGGTTSKYFTNVLRSRCRHTKQKDTGTAFFEITTNSGKVNPQELLKMVVSLREVNEFHEFCAEKFYIELMKNPLIKECSVMLLYARRGSLDICPVRATKITMIPSSLTSKYLYTKKTMGQ